MYKKDLTEYGQDVMSKFESAFRQAKNPEVNATAEAIVAEGPIGTATHAEEVTMEIDSPSKTKATDKCRVKPSMEEQSVPVDDSCGEASAPAPVIMAGSVVSHQPEEMEATTGIAMATGGGDASNEPQVDIQTLN